MPGPPRTPTAILKARGSRKVDERHNEPLSPGEPVCPEWLGEFARECWFQLLPQLKRMKVAGEVDEKALARYCSIWGAWRECEEFIREHGMTHEGKHGPVEYAQVGRAARLADQLLKLEIQFGMTPAARARLATDGPKKQQDGGKAKYFAG